MRHVIFSIVVAVSQTSNHVFETWIRIVNKGCAGARALLIDYRSICSNEQRGYNLSMGLAPKYYQTYNISKGLATFQWDLPISVARLTTFPRDSSHCP